MGLAERSEQHRPRVLRDRGALEGDAEEIKTRLHPVLRLPRQACRVIARWVGLCGTRLPGARQSRDALA